MDTTHATTTGPGTPEQLCVCGHPATRHADPATGDSRCLAVEDRRDLLEHPGDGRDTLDAYCGCLRFRAP